jgi:hypothetical protein
MVNNMVGPNGIGVEFQPRRADGTIHEPYAAALRKAEKIRQYGGEAGYKLHLRQVAKERRAKKAAEFGGEAGYKAHLRQLAKERRDKKKAAGG